MNAEHKGGVIMAKKKLTQYMRFKEEVAERAPQLQKDVDAIRTLLRENYGFTEEANNFNMSEEAIRGRKGTGRYACFESSQDRICLTVFLPQVHNTISSTGRAVHILAHNGKFVFAMSGTFKAAALNDGSKTMKQLEQCKEFFEDIRQVNPRYLGE